MTNTISKTELDKLFKKAEVKAIGATMIDSFDDEKETLNSLSYDMFFEGMDSKIDIDKMLINMKYIILY